MTMTIQLKRKKKLSQAFQESLDGLALDIEKLQPRVDKVFEVGRAEGLNDKQIGKEIRKKMKGHYGRQTIWRVFENYPDAKQIEKRNKSKYGNKKLPSDEKPETDKYRNYQEIIATKNKLLKEKDEQIKGLQRQLTEANKKIAQLEKAVKVKERLNVKTPEDVEKRKQDIGAKLRAHQLKRLGEGGEQKE